MVATLEVYFSVTLEAKISSEHLIQTESTYLSLRSSDALRFKVTVRSTVDRKSLQNKVFKCPVKPKSFTRT